MGDSPAFQFYADDYLVGTMTMTLAEKGAYMDCLAYQWSVGAVPGDDPKALARVMRCTPAEARKTWLVVASKFVRGEDGQWRNRRLEKERDKQTAYRESRAVAGRLGGLAKGKHTASTASSVLVTGARDSAVALELAKPSSPSSSPFPSPDPPSKNDGGARVARSASSPALIRSPLEREKALRYSAFVGARLEVPHKLHSDFCRTLGGDDPASVLTAWYRDVDAEIEASREPILPDVWKWLEARFKPWAQSRVTEDVLAKWVSEGVQRGA